VKVGTHTLNTQLEAAVTTVVVLGTTLFALDLGSAAYETRRRPAAVLVSGRAADAISSSRNTVRPVHLVGIHLRTAGATRVAFGRSVPAFCVVLRGVVAPGREPLESGQLG
jgi:hypothetical protein